MHLVLNDQFISFNPNIEEVSKDIYKEEIIPLEIEEPVFDENRQWVESARGLRPF